jgi:hypothetical protein
MISPIHDKLNATAINVAALFGACVTIALIPLPY